MASDGGKLRVAAYCRVSTDGDDQKNSFESQKRYFSETVSKHPDHILTQIFADEGISGTSTKKRREFLRMMESARTGEFDLLLTKEISRFARNTLDSIRYTRELKRHGVGVIFLTDGIDTRDGDAELRLSILSSIAQEESRRTSERVKWGQKRRMEAGVVFGRSMLGYDVQGGVITKNERGAEIVRTIFRKYTEEGKGTHVIARELREENVITPHIKAWTAAGVLRILKNEKYCGDLVQKKTYTPDFLTHEKKYNRGEEELVILRDHHEPIVSREMFERASALLHERGGQTGKPKYSEKHPFSGRIVCGGCGRTLTARRRSGGGTVFRCRTVGCVMRFGLREETALLMAREAFHALEFSHEEVKKPIFSALSAGGNLPRAEENMRLIELYAAGDITHGEFLAMREKYARRAAMAALDAARKERMEAALEHLLSRGGDGDFFRMLSPRIEVFSAKDIVFSFADLPMNFRFGTVGKGAGQGIFLIEAESDGNLLYSSQKCDRMGTYHNEEDHDG